ncbi:ferritin [Desulfovibrio inopinatus]|uniref:ferritin n=1 Tax=Desulfovibrio inopinatus TaxID=102109 RepID=UPI0003FA5A4B|nr:ferritin [Desulfovibrio inopinatus]
MLSKEMEKALNDQVKWELYSAYLYLSMAAYFDNLGLPGAANWMRCQEQEERFHALRFFDFISERGGRVELQTIEAPKADWENPLQVFEETLEHEQLVTKRINDLMDMAVTERDHATITYLQWFISEQVEEEATVGDVIAKLKLVEKTNGGMFMLDKDLGLRVFTPPVIN